MVRGFFLDLVCPAGRLFGMDDGKRKHRDQPDNIAYSPTISFPDSSVAIGGEIGPYKLLSILGEGGFGIVYLADQKHPVKRQVALKIIKPGMDTKQVIARFEAERQALALLDHPNIAYVFSAGSTEAGRPYFAMEYIKGVPITEYCDSHKLNIEERLKLFIQVCEAVQHAHQKGIIHRDIKPSNIIVTSQDGKAIPKVIDFGVAKAISMPLTEKTMFTQQGQLIGTPEYMSPEQADQKEKDIDTRTDIYSLGVVLYELLAGALPFESETLREGGHAEIQRIIREEEPPRPSAKLSRLKANAPTIAQNRHTEPSALMNALHRELEWIPLMAIRKDREQRYKTASELARDVQHYLDGYPLIAGPESTLYRMKKFIHKRKGWVAAVGAIAVVLTAGFVISSFLYVQAEHAKMNETRHRQVAERAAIRANEEAEALRRQLYSNYVIRAEKALEANNLNHARDLLNQCPKDLRGWEWYHLWYTPSQSIRRLTGHSDRISCVAFSPDSKRIVSGSFDRTVKIWDAETGHEMMTLAGHSRQVSSVVFSPDGTRIASGCLDGTIKLWDAETGNEIKTLPRGQRSVSEVALSPDGTQIVSGYWNHMAKVWDIESGKEMMVLTMKDPASEIVSVAYSPDGKKIVSGSDHETIIWDADTGNKIMALPRHPAFTWSVAFSPDGKKIVSCGGAAKVWDVETGDEIMSLVDPAWGISRAIYSPDGRRIITGGAELKIGSNQNSSVKLWDAETGNEMTALKGLSEQVYDSVFSPNGRLIVSCSENAITVWYSASPEEVNILDQADGFIDESWTPVEQESEGALSVHDAIDCLQKACELTDWNHHEYIRTLAAAYSETGHWKKAVEYQRKAIDTIPIEGESEWLGRYEYLLDLYLSKKPYHLRGVRSFTTGELVARWDFEKVEDETVFDSSGNGLHGTLIGNAQIFDDPERGKVLSLDGTDGYVDCGNNWAFNITGSLTVSAWIKVNQFDGDYNAIISKGEGAWRLLRHGSTDHIQFAASGISNNVWGYIAGTVNVYDGQWHHLVGVYDGKAISMYIDGTLNVSEEATGHILMDDTPVFIGADDIEERHWNGLIDSVRVYSYALSAERISEIYRDQD
jgi:WD40 repeat protein/serine/threonine protein kinase